MMNNELNAMINTVSEEIIELENMFDSYDAWQEVYNNHQFDAFNKPVFRAALAMYDAMEENMKETAVSIMEHFCELVDWYEENNKDNKETVKIAINKKYNLFDEECYSVVECGEIYMPTELYFLLTRETDLDWIVEA